MPKNDPEFIYEGEVNLDDYRSIKKASLKGWLTVLLIFATLAGLLTFLFTEIPSNTKLKNKTELKQKDIKNDKSIPVKYKDAMVQVKAFSQKKHMSRKAIYDKMVIDGGSFPEEAITYALENIPVDYNQNALEKAKELSQKLGSANKQDIYEILLYDEEDGGFTKKEAQYAVDHL